MVKLTIQDLNLSGKKVLIRVDFNVPVDKEGHITDDTRIQESIKSIQYALDHQASVILISHMGRPDGKKNLKYTLKPCADRLSTLLNREVLFATDPLSAETETLCSQLKPGDVVLLENLRFYEAEEDPSKDPSFAKKLASYADLFVNDGFGCAHRAHSSVTEIPKYIAQSVAGFLMQKEIINIGGLLEKPKRPFYALIGGSKISSKIGVLEALLDKVDAIFVGGGMTYTFWKASGISIGKSIFEEKEIETAKRLQKKCIEKNVKLFLAEDVIAADAFNEKANTLICTAEEGIPDAFEGMDIGPKTLITWKAALQNAKTIFWNGPFGVFELPPFAKGTLAIAQTLAKLPITTIVGGGDSVAAIVQFGLKNSFTHLSTGGGASLEYIELGKLPGIEALSDK